jgi:hypothetical protein
MSTRNNELELHKARTASQNWFETMAFVRTQQAIHVIHDKAAG